MVLSEVSFGKGPKLGICCRKKGTFGNFDTFVVNSMNFIPLFPQLQFEYLFASTLRSLEVLFFENFRGLNKSWYSFIKQRAFCCFIDFVCF